MNIEHIVANAPYYTNTFMLTEDNEVAVIDPAADVSCYTKRARDGMKLLLTHGHHDHIGAVKALQADGAQLYMSKEDAEHFGITPDVIIKDKDRINIGSTELLVIATPGHTPGSVCYYTEGHLFAGDTLFYHNCGRCDLPGGDYGTMLKSLKLLSTLSPNTKVYPGHDRFGLMSDEMIYNPYIREALSK